MQILWIKSVHIIFVTSWFAGLFYLPRIFVNLSMVPKESVAEHERLLLMARKLYRFTTILMVPALSLGFLLVWQEDLFSPQSANVHIGWLHAKLTVVFCTVLYHFWCARHLGQFQTRTDERSHIWYRWFNEIPVVFLTATVILVVVKPF